MKTTTSAANRIDAALQARLDFIKRFDVLAMCDPQYARVAMRTFAIPNGARRSKSERTRKQLKRLEAEGGRRLLVVLPPEVADALNALKSGGHAASATASVVRALMEDRARSGSVGQGVHV